MKGFISALGLLAATSANADLSQCQVFASQGVFPSDMVICPALGCRATSFNYAAGASVGVPTGTRAYGYTTYPFAPREDKRYTDFVYNADTETWLMEDPGYFLSSASVPNGTVVVFEFGGSQYKSTYNPLTRFRSATALSACQE